MGDMDSSTRSTDHMLGGHDDVDFSLSGISLSSLGDKNKVHRKGSSSSDDEEEEHDNRFNAKQSKSNFDHLIPKKHHNKLNKLHKTNSSNNSKNNNSDSTTNNTKSRPAKDTPMHHEVEPVGKDNTIGKARYQLWEGKNKFLCGGRIMMGVHSKHLLMTTLLLLATNALFLFLLVPLLDQPLLFEIGVAIGSVNFLFLFLTALTDPGIIPRRPPSSLLQNMSADAREKMQYCHTCRIVRPPRAKHCRYCDNCVEVFDHHW
jgi:hypothetical protein